MLPIPPDSAFEPGGPLHGFSPVDADFTPDIVDLHFGYDPHLFARAEFTRRAAFVAQALAPHALEDKTLELEIGYLPDGRMAIVPAPPFSFGAYAVEDLQ